MIIGVTSVQAGFYQTKRGEWFDFHARRILQGLLHAVDWRCITYQKDWYYFFELLVPVMSWVLFR